MTGGFATIAGTVLAAYIGFGIPADQIISGSVMAAPTALAVSKLIYPETEESKTTFKNIKMEKDENISNVLDAASQGASAAIMLVLNIAASLIAFLAFVAFLDATVGNSFFINFILHTTSFQIFYPYYIIEGKLLLYGKKTRPSCQQHYMQLRLAR